MLKEFRILRSHGKQYIRDLRTQPVPGPFRGRPVISGDITEGEVKLVSEMCPTGAIDSNSGSINLGKCLFCMECSFLVPDRIMFTNDYRIAVNRMSDMVIDPGQDRPLRPDESSIRKVIRKTFRGALKLRQVSAGGDNSAEMELSASGNVNFDFGRYGVEFVASPRHADGIVVTGPLCENMAEALRITLESVPEPRLIILAGTDAISGGLFSESSAVDRKFIEENAVDLYVPGNPPHPLTYINGVMDLLGLSPA